MQKPKHAGTVGGALVTAAFGTTFWIWPDIRQPPPGLEGALALLVTVTIGSIRGWLEKRRGS